MRALAVAVLMFGAVGCGDDGGNKVVPDTVLDDVPAQLSKDTHVRITFHAAGNANNFQCTLDGGAPTQCISPFEQDVAEGQHTFAVAAMLNQRIDDTPAMVTWKIDATAPETSIDMGPPALDNSLNPTITFSGTDAGGGAVTFECRIDGAAFAACTSPDALTVADGAHTFEVRAVDAAGNPDASPAQHMWTVDSSTPDTTITSGPATGSTSGADVSFAFESPDSTATFDCQLDAGAFAACTSPQAFTGLSEGAHTFTVRAKNTAGTVDPTPATRMWTVDDTAPPVTIVTHPTDPSNDATPDFTFSSTDANATFECQIDGTIPYAACTSPWTATTIPDGMQTFRVRATDAVGNTGPEATFTWTIDTMPPTVTITGGPTGPVATSSATITFTTTGMPVTTQCMLDTGAFANCASPAALTGLSDGAHTFTVKVTDAAGNASMDSRMWTVDTTPPVVTITSGPTGPTSDTTPTFMFTVTGTAMTVQCSTGGAFAACTSPFTTAALPDGPHTVTVRATDSVGNIGADSRSFTVDTTAPTVTINTHPSDPTSTTSAAFTFAVSEGTPQCKLDGAAFANCTSANAQSYAGPLAAGSHTFTVQSTDGAGNTGSDTFTWTIDLTLPTVTINTHPNDPTNVRSAAFTFTASEGTPQCKLDGGAFVNCTTATSQSYAGPLAAGTHTFTVQTSDTAGNTGSASFTWVIDLTPPTVAITMHPDDPTNVRTAAFAFTVSEGTPQCKLDAGAFAACATATMQSYAGPLAAGSHTFTVQTSDTAGNTANATFTWLIDLTPPTIAINTHPADPTNATTAAFTFTASDGTPECKLDTGAFATCTTATTQSYSSLGAGSHMFTVQTTDAAGNSASASFPWVIDLTAPTVMINTHPADPTNVRTAAFTFTASEGTPQCKLDTGAFATCTSTTAQSYAGPLAAGSHTFTVQTSDAAGNSDTATFTWQIDLTAPTVTISTHPADPTNVRTASFTFTVSEGTPQCKLDTGTFAACATSTSQSYAGPLAAGSHTFTVQTTDTAGNTGSAAFTWLIDLTPPTVTINTQPNNPTNSTSAAFTFTVSEGTPQCKLDAGSFVNCTSSTAQSYAGPLGEGTHTFTVQTSDAAGNSASDSFSWSIDLTGPTVTITPVLPDPTANQTPAIAFTVSADAASQTCKVDTSSAVACSPPTFTPAALGDGSHTITITALDAVGNPGSASTTFSVDHTGPVVTFDQKPPTQWPVNYFTFTWHANETATYECSLNGAAFAPCTTPASVTFSYAAQTYAVRGKDSLGNLGSATTASFTPAVGQVLHYPWEQGKTNNTSLLAQVGSLSPDGTVTLPFVGGFAGSALGVFGSSVASHTYAGTRAAISSSPDTHATMSMFVRTQPQITWDGTLFSTQNSTTGGMKMTIGQDPASGLPLITLTVYEAGTPYSVTGTLPAANEWDEVGVISTGGPGKGATLIINGQKLGTAVPPTHIGFDISQAPDLTVGPAKGVDIDDLRFFNYALSSTEFCTVLMRTTVPTCSVATRAPYVEFDFEGPTITDSGRSHAPPTPPQAFSTYNGTLGKGLKVGGTGFTLPNFDKIDQTQPHTIAMWVYGGSPPDTLFDSTLACQVGAPVPLCSLKISFDDSHRFVVFAATGPAAAQQSTTVTSAVDTARFANLVVTEQKSGDVTTGITIYVNGRREAVVTFPSGNLFTRFNPTVTLPQAGGTAIDEIELWPRDLSLSEELLCENGFDGSWNPATSRCSLTSN